MNCKTCGVPDEIMDGYLEAAMRREWGVRLLRAIRVALKERAEAIGRGVDFVETLKGREVLIFHGGKDQLIP